MQGNLKQIQLPEVLQFISMGKSTGLLTIRDPKGNEITLMIASGRIINSSALDRRRRLGELLVQRGILKRSVLSQILTLQRTIESDKRLGQILVERDYIQESTIREVLHLQLEEEIWNLFGLDSGEFKFDHCEESKLGEALVHIEIDPLLIEGTRRQDEWRKISRTIPGDRVIPTLKGNVRISDRKDKLRFSPSEWKVLAQINGRTSIKGVVNRASMGRFEVYRIVAELVDRGLVTIREVDRNSVESAPMLSAAQTSGAHPMTTAKTGGGLFSMLTGSGPSRRDDRAEKLACVSPIGALSHLVNRQVETIPPPRSGENDSRLLADIWADQASIYTKADLIKVDRGALNADLAESYLRLFEFGEAVQDCYEDSLEALIHTVDALYRISVARQGDKAAARAIKELLDDLAPRITVTYAREFKIEERIPATLKIAA